MLNTKTSPSFCKQMEHVKYVKIFKKLAVTNFNEQ